MSLGGLLRAFVFIALGALIGGCAEAPALPGALPNALSSFVVWSQVGIVPEIDSRGDGVDVVRVRGGEVLRIEFGSNKTVEIGERLSAGQSFAESWSARTPRQGVLLVRTSAFSNALLLPRGAALRVYRGHGSDPGYHWFELEDRVLAWASGPLPQPFPSVAPGERVDFASFAVLDRVLADAVLNASDRESARAQAVAVRAVVGLRAVRALRPPTGLPYFFDTALNSSPRIGATVGGHPAYPVSRGKPLELPVSGPGVLHIWARSPNAADPALLRVFEGDRARAFAQLTAPRVPLTSRDIAGVGAAATTPIRRAIVHVPPGLHRYRVEGSGDVLVSPLLAEPIVHLEQIQQEDEAVQLARARHACIRGGAAPICAFALALLGEDEVRERSDGTISEWAHALAQSPALAQKVALDLARSGPRDPTPELDLAASDGDPQALAALGRAVAHSVDDAARAAWVHSLSQGTEWQVAESGAGGTPWLSAAADGAASRECASRGSTETAELTSSEAEYQTVVWHGVPTVELAVTSECNDLRPVELLVDGERVTAVPSAPFVRLRVRVRGERARIRRLDDSTSRVAALPVRTGDCRMRFESLRAPVVAATVPIFRVNAEPGSAGVEVWLRAGAPRAELGITVLGANGASAQTARLSVPRAAGLTAYDGLGVLWTRIARVPLSAPPGASVRIAGSAEVAVRQLVRVARRKPTNAPAAPPSEPVVLDETKLDETTREILAQPRDARGSLYLKRALLLAAGGARGPALADARAAAQLGVRGPDQGEPIALVQAAIRRLPIPVEPLPDGVNAYGIEPDFESGARKCQVETSGVRAHLERMLDATSQEREVPAVAQFEVGRAASVFSLHEQATLDPRAGHLLSRVLAGSRWKLRPELVASAPRVREAREARHDGPLDSDGNLRPRVVVGARFAPGTYATVLPDRPVKALVSGIPAGARVHLELACGARDPAAAESACPVELLFDGKPAAVKIEQDGRGTVPIPDARSRSAPLLLSLRDEPGDWVALARLVVDRPLPKAVKIDDGQWAIASKPSELRALISEGRSVSLELAGPTLLRLDARAESETRTELVLMVDGHERSLPADGTAVVVPVVKAEAVILRARGGALSLAVAERVASERPTKGKEPEKTVRPAAPAPPIGLALDAAPDDSEPTWLQRAERSPRPLTPLQAALGTAVAETGVVSGKLRQGVTAPWADAYAFNLLGYRRRVESIGLWTRADVFSRIRPGEPTYGAQAEFYEDFEHAHVRVTGSITAESQRAAGLQGRSLMARGFLEYSYRAARDLFVLPRLGYDGMYSTIARRPTSLAYVDDEVYSPYRSRRPTFLFAQALLWYAPYFNEILYLRMRGTFDAKARALSHSAAVVGAFIAFGDLDLSGQAQTVWYVPRDSLSNHAHVEMLTGVVARYSFWSGLGSLGITPGLSAQARPQDAGWQVTAFLNIFASFRRGLRDFSSLELDFPEQLSGGIPWRGATPGGYQ